MDSAEIVEVIQDFVTLKKRGVNFLGLCPFHNEKTPSFTVSPSKGIYKCFGCGRGGNVVNFLMEHEHLNYPEALKFLASKYHIEVIEKELTPEEIQQQNERESLLVVLKFAQHYFENLLFHNEDGKAIGLAYFKERGFRQDILRKFGVGYALDQSEAFTKHAQKSGYKLEFLVKAGLTIQKEQRTFDRFFGRVIFPIHGLSGQVIGFGGRLLKSAVKAAKYINSPETDVYHKSRVLYGMYHARKAIVEKNKCFLVEGYTDVMSMHQIGIENVVASSGTSLTVEQIRLIKRFTTMVTVIFDGDAAGLKAALRGIDLILEEGLNVKVVVLPDGEDPDSYSKSISATRFIQFIEENERDFIKFKTTLLIRDAQNDPIQKANLIRDIVRSIASIPDGINRAVYLRECSSLLSVDEQVLYHETNKFRRKNLEQKYRQQKSFEQRIEGPVPSQKQDATSDYDSETQEREIIRLLLNYADKQLFTIEEENGEKHPITVVEFVLSELLNDELTLDHPVYQQIIDEFSYLLSQKKPMTHKYFTNHSDPKISEISARLVAPTYGLSKIWKRHENYLQTEEMKLKEIVPETLTAFKNKRVIKAARLLQIQLTEAQEKNDFNAIMALQERLIFLNSLKRELAKNLGHRTII
jgi:DNA primase